MKNQIAFYLNGELCEVEAERAGLMLSDFLRYEKCLTGTKVVCAEGDCGACTVLRYAPLLCGLDSQNFQPINSCIVPLANLHGQHIITVEGVEYDNGMHEVQNALVETHGTQCGFCTPGFIMGLAGLYEEKLERGEDSINEVETKNALTGNLCRCTGYNSIIEAGSRINLKKVQSLKSRYHTSEVESNLYKINQTPLKLKAKDYSYYAPNTYEEAVKYLNENPDTQIIANATDLGVVYNKRRIRLNNLLSLHLIPEAYFLGELNGEVTIGSRVTLTELRHFMKVNLLEYANYLDIFAAPGIKNNATLIGNIATASPIGDNAPILLSLNATISLLSIRGERTIPLSDFFLDYRKTAKTSDEIITGINFKIPKESRLKFLKTSIRKDLDISTVNMGLNAEIVDGTINKITIGAGGIAAIPMRLKKTEKYLIGKTLDVKVIEEACKTAQSEFTPIDDVRSTATYRRLVVDNYIRRYLSDVMEGRL